MNDLRWWSCILAIPNPSHSLIVLPTLDLDVWVDASTSLGIGILVDSHWATWKLVEGWNSHSQDIGWAEAVVIELAVVWLTSSHFHDGCVRLNCDNTSVIHSFWRGHSHNPSWNDCLLHISACLATANLTIELSYFQSAFNRADSLSRGILGPPELCLKSLIVLPDALCSLLTPL